MKITKIFNTPLKYLLIAIASLLALAIIFGAIFGVNTSTELSGGSQVSINITDPDTSEVLNANKVLGQAKSALSANHLIVEKHMVESNGTKTYLVINVTNRKVTNADEVRAQIATKTGIDVANISGFKTINPAFSPVSIVLFGVGVLVAIIILFVVCLKRYKQAGSLTIGLVNLASVIMYFSVIILTRIWLNWASLVSLMISLVITNVILVALLENIKGNISLKQYSGYTEKEITSHFAQKLFIPAVFVCGAIFVMGFALLWVFNAYVQLLALSLMIASLISFFASLILATSVYSNLLIVYNIKQKQKTSKNPNLKKQR